MMSKNQHGYLLLQCAIALFCAGIGLSLLLKLHVKSLQAQKILQAQAWVVMHAASARHIQHFYSSHAQQGWQQSLERALPAPVSQIAWQREGAIHVCWEGDGCWLLE
ncbi:MAG: hypothetical protein ACHQAX_00895 [Gammaproteobacteria bacterium]